ncbi:hypothetical protein V5E97_31835 [Singulisphaera sp. Ch08]|uniref:Uncharacterized protein n=1 Tax=Singulisphaera sp. Ch08 TaxID=3120278 RepID=A0AAU7CC22_9BACT
MSALQTRLLAEIARRLPFWARDEVVDPPRLTVGVEHELFLLEAGRPCNHGGSQALFAAMAREGWAPRIDPGSGLTDGVSADLGGGGRAWVKYEYDPHLIEICTPYSAEVADVAKYLKLAWQGLICAAEQVGLTVASIPFMDVADQLALAAATRLTTTRQLQSTRVRLVTHAGNNAALAGFPAWTAATQTQVGGLPWFARPSLVDALYRIEPAAGAMAYRRPPGPAAAMFTRRWEGYEAVYGLTALLGFPDFRSGWTLEAWADALLDAPLAGTPDNSWALRRTRDLSEPPGGNWDVFLERVRDLQLVRPRMSGTLEFRGDPAQPTVEAVIEVAEARLAACRRALDDDVPSGDYQDARRQWLGGEWLP